jgi:hypothetical protein
MSHLSIADVPSTIISLAASDSESELEFYSEEDLDAIPQIDNNSGYVYFEEVIMYVFCHF